MCYNAGQVPSFPRRGWHRWHPNRRATLARRERMYIMGRSYEPFATCAWRPKGVRALEKPIEEPANKPPKYYVYVIRHAGAPFPRLNGASDILYIGKGTGGRVLTLWNGGHSAIRALSRVREVLKTTSSPGVKVDLYPCDSDLEAALKETQRLTEYASAHGETPPCNARWEGYILGRYLNALAEVGMDRGRQYVRCYDAPANEPVATWCDVMEDKTTWCWSMAWVWTDDWLETDPSEHDEWKGRLIFVKDADQVPGGERLPESLRAVQRARLVMSCQADRLGDIEGDEGEKLISELARVSTSMSGAAASGMAGVYEVAEQLCRK